MSRIYVTLICLLIVSTGFSQTASDLPLTFLKSADTTKPLVVYLSGDGGMNSFSSNFMRTFNRNGYSVIGLNSKEYFWKKKTPEQTAADLNNLIAANLHEGKHRGFIVIGYSFGADVAPFAFSRLPALLHGKAKQLIMIAPSETTTFEVKLLDMLGSSRNEGADVVAELNKIDKPVLLVLSKSERDFPVHNVKTRNKQVLNLPGDHHFNNDVQNLFQQIQPAMLN